MCRRWYEQRDNPPEGVESVVMEEKRVRLQIKGKPVEIRYRTAGTGPVVLYLHGNLGSSLWYEKVMDLAGFTTIAPDLPNFGTSDSTGDFSMAAYALAVKEFLVKLEISSTVLVGHSLGGVVAMEMAASNPELIRKLILLSPGPIEGLVTPKEYYPVIESYKSTRELLKKALSTVVPSLNDPVLLDKLTDQAQLMHPDAFTSHPDELAAADYQRRLGRLSIPVLILRGELDMLITEDMARRTARHLGGEYRELAGVGHSPMVEQPELFIRQLQGFIEE